MRLLLVAPSGSGAELDQIPEIREISRLHTTTVLHGPVDLAAVEEAVRDDIYDGIHFATHLGDHPEWDRLMLSDGVTLTMSDVASIARMAAAKFVFFNTCHSARFAAYMVAHGVGTAIYTTIPLPDRDAWRMPLRFYQHIARQEEGEGSYILSDAFDRTHPNDGLYGLVVSPYYTAKLSEEVAEISVELKKLADAVTENRKALERLAAGAGAGRTVQVLMALILVVLVYMAVTGG